ncbi:MAG: peptidase domain-containing ABC transporter [Bacteroidales bacterium]|nr:peptidase domain-containing ABC transporter [Bacteroidales bacterium]
MFPYFKQQDSSDCGPTCLKIIIKHYGRNIGISQLRELCNTDSEGSSIKSIIYAGNKIGFDMLGVKSQIEKLNNQDLVLFEELPLPFILHWQEKHFVVVYKITKEKVYISDPAKGKLVYKLSDLSKYIYNKNNYARVILLEPSSAFHSNENIYFKNQDNKLKILFVKKYVSAEKKYIFRLFLIIFLSAVLNVSSPFITQFSFDSGILAKNLDVIISVFIIQLIVFIFTSTFSYFNSYVSNIVSRNINIKLSIDFITKLFTIPASYFQKKKVSDFYQRIMDLNRIESFITYNFANILMSVISLIVSSIICIYYNYSIFFIVIIFSVLNLFWITFSIRKKQVLDYEKFDINSKIHRTLIEIIEGINDIKISNSSNNKLENLSNSQKKSYANNLKYIKLNQSLSIGGGLITNLGSGFITFYTAYLTLDNTISIGEMAAIQMVVGQLTSTINNLTNTVSTLQDTKFSLERILETQIVPTDNIGKEKANNNTSIQFKDVSFSYSELNKNILNKLNFTIEKGRTTAIVGLSGSGKTTLIKMLLKLIQPQTGEIIFNNSLNINKINTDEWYKQCGAVMQDGYIFTDTIKNNIVLNSTNYNKTKYEESLRCAELLSFVENLPIKHDTIIGKEGLNLSSGQKQRILLARLFYKNPKFIFLDEATNSLDSETESKIMNNINNFFVESTKVIVAHRLNTIKHADKIIILKNGEIAEIGTHEDLLENKSFYFNLVQEQLN